MSNNTQNIEKYLSKSAKEELEKILYNEKIDILRKAEQIAKESRRSEEEISLKDIINARDNSVSFSNNFEEKSQKIFFYGKIVFYAGMIYSVLGLIIYLYQNKGININENVGLIIATLGGIVSGASFFFIERVFSRQKAHISKAQRVTINNHDNALIVIGRWMVIERMLSKIISDQTDKEVTSFNQIVSYLNSGNFDPELATTIISLLKTRNAVVHNKLEATDPLVKGYAHLADNVIDQLESYSVHG